MGSTIHTIPFTESNPSLIIHTHIKERFSQMETSRCSHRKTSFHYENFMVFIAWGPKEIFLFHKVAVQGKFSVQKHLFIVKILWFFLFYFSMWSRRNFFISHSGCWGKFSDSALGWSILSSIFHFLWFSLDFNFMTH